MNKTNKMYFDGFHTGTYTVFKDSRYIYYRSGIEGMLVWIQGIEPIGKVPDFQKDVI